MLAHTRWASVGIISEAERAPAEPRGARRRPRGPYVVAALNGDVDNYADLKALEALQFPAEITTDAKVIPALVSRRIAAGADADRGVPRTVAAFEGSVAIARAVGGRPRPRAARAAGQRPGAVRRARRRRVRRRERAVRRRRGVRPLPAPRRRDACSIPASPRARARSWSLDAPQAGTLAGIERLVVRRHARCRSPTPSCSTPRSRRATSTAATRRTTSSRRSPRRRRRSARRCAASIVDDDGRLEVRLLGRGAARRRRRAAARRRDPAGARHRPGHRRDRRAEPRARCSRGARRPTAVAVEAVTATELSGFGLDADMHDTLVVAISQAGTTTDTNRTVDLARGRGARGDRDREPAQQRPRRQGRRRALHVRRPRRGDERRVDEGVLRAGRGRASCSRSRSPPSSARRRRRRAPTAHERARGAARAARRDARGARAAGPRSRAAAQRHALAAPVVGGRRQRREPGRGRRDADQALGALLQVDRVRRHRGQEAHRPLVRADDPRVRGRPARLERRRRRQGGRDLPRAQGGADRDRRRRRRRASSPRSRRSSVPAVHPDARVRAVARWSGTCSATRPRSRSTRSARPLREARGCIEALVGSAREGDDLLRRARGRARSRCADRFFDGLRTASYDGALEAGTAVRLASLLRYATGVVPLDAYQVEFGKVGTPSTVVEDLTAALTKAIEELTRPDRRDQAPGQDRHRRHLPLRRDAAAGAARAGGARDRRRRATASRYRALRTLVALDPAVDAVVGLDALPHRRRSEPAGATIDVVDRGGIARDIPSRTDDNPTLRGTKHRAASEREVTVVRGRADGRTLVIVPEVKGNQTTGLTLLHVRFHDRLPADGRAPRARGLPRPLRGHRRPGHGDRAGHARRRARRRSTSSSCSPSRSCRLADRWKS